MERSFGKKNNNKYDFQCRASLAVTGISPPRQTPRQHPDNLIICMTLAMRPGWGLGGEEDGRGFAELQPPKKGAAAPCNRPEPHSSAVEVRAEGGAAGPAALWGRRAGAVPEAGPGAARIFILACAATRRRAVAARRGTAERGNDVNLLFTFQPRMTEQGERRINQPPGDPPGGKKNTPRRGRGKHMDPGPRCIIRPARSCAPLPPPVGVGMGGTRGGTERARRRLQRSGASVPGCCIPTGGQ